LETASSRTDVRSASSGAFDPPALADRTSLAATIILVWALAALRDLFAVTRKHTLAH
jgi:hypothetical protein